MRNSVHNLLIGTALSILVFFAISFLTFLKSILLPSFNYSVDIGFPFRYYYQFYGNGYPLHEWSPLHLLLDCGLVWLLVTGSCLLVRRPKSASFGSGSASAVAGAAKTVQVG